MAYATINLDNYIGDFSDEELIEEIKARGYNVNEDVDIASIEQYWNQGNRKETLILLERQFPELIGISKLLD